MAFPGHYSSNLLSKNLTFCDAHRILENFKIPVCLLEMFTGFIPTWPVVPTKDIPTVSFREPWKRELARNNPNRYTHTPCSEHNSSNLKFSVIDLVNNWSWSTCPHCQCCYCTFYKASIKIWKILTNIAGSKLPTIRTWHGYKGHQRLP